jgi:bacterioferritin
MTITDAQPAYGILDPVMEGEREELLRRLEDAYWKELETVLNHIANSINLDGVRAREISATLSDDIDDELRHARQIGERIKQLYGSVPGSQGFFAEQVYLQPPVEHTNVCHVIAGVITAENDAIEGYNAIIRFCDGIDAVTQDLITRILRDEERHRRRFEGFLRECGPRVMSDTETPDCT